ncbi:MAG: Error-prone repair protein ImuA [Pedobacter sp.]|nr:MAG: Error-prone repair protein ImuA [Pedobacter sp.]
MEQSPTILKQHTVELLRKSILTMQGSRRQGEINTISTGLGPIEAAFPNKTFPTGAVHEFTSQAFSHVAATNGFIGGILSSLMQKGGACLWIGTKRSVFPAALHLFGINPERIIFIDPTHTKHALWAIEEALKCSTLAAVVGELSDLTFTQSQRLQLAVEQSHVTGFIHRIGARSNNAMACVSRWKITPVLSESDGLPGLGLPRWNVQLIKVRNGIPGAWQLEWSAKGFRQVLSVVTDTQITAQRKAG